MFNVDFINGLRIIFAAFFLCINFFSTLVWAGEKNELLELSQSERWMNLLRYERSFFGLTSKSSAIKDKVFFFSEDGKTDPYGELIATIEAMKKPESKFSDVNQHPVCRFPARYKWLRQNISDIQKSDLLSKCRDYQKWRSNGKVTSISLYFATGYFGNPASFFGHPLLKFNVGSGESAFVDASLNYGAMTPEGENPILYVLKGLFGGYSASFTHHDFFYHSHNYSETELRDLWEYKLNLEPNEVEYIVDRTWELLGKNHPYYFLVDNCAYRMAELLEEVFEQKLIVRNKLYVIPIDLYDNLVKGKRHDGQPLVSMIRVVPSRFSRLAEMYSQLDDENQGFVKSAIDEPQKIEDLALLEKPEKVKAQLADTLISYFAFKKLQEPEVEQYNKHRVRVIRERFKISEKSGFESLEFPDAKAPHESQNSFGIMLVQAYSDTIGYFNELSLRPALYDELNPTVGRENNTSLVVFDTTLRLNKGFFSLNKLDFFRVSSLNTPSIDLPEVGKISWRAQLSLKSPTELCDNCVVPYISGGIGYSRNLLSGVDVYALAKLSVQENKFDMGTIYIGPEIGAFVEPVSWWKLYAGYELEAFQNGFKLKTDIWKLEQRFGSSKSWDLRLDYFQREDKQLRLNLGLYL